MSCEAKVWYDDDGWLWNGICDSGGEFCKDSLQEVLAEIEEVENKGRPMRWTLHVFKGGLIGLRGWIC